MCNDNNNEQFKPIKIKIKLKVAGYMTDHNGVKLYAYKKDVQDREVYEIEIDWKYLKGINFL